MTDITNDNGSITEWVIDGMPIRRSVMGAAQVVKLGHHYYPEESIQRAIDDIKARSLVDGLTKADRLLISILAP